MSTRKLPSRPHLQHLKNQARDLVKAHRGNDAEAAARIKAHLPRLANSTKEIIGKARFTILDAQLVIAHEYGFPSWPKLKECVEGDTAVAKLPHHPFSKDLQYYTDRAEGLLSVHKTGQQRALDLIRTSHPKFKEATDEEIRSAEITLEDAKWIYAREHGHADWTSFARHIKALEKGEVQDPFMAAYEAIETGDVNGVQKCIQQNPALIHAQGTNGNSLLNLAGSFKREKIVRMLLDAGADPDLANNKGWTPLHQAAYSNQTKLIEWYLRAEASIDAEAHGEGGTPLVQALFWGHRAAADRLAKQEVVPNNLRVAAGLGRSKLVKECFNKDGSLKQHAGAHREFHRPHSGFPPWKPAQDRQQIIDEALVWACKCGRTEVLEFLLGQGANLNADPYRGTPLTWAAVNDRQETVKWLLEHGADVNHKGTFGGPGHGQGVTALHISAQSGKMEMVKLLIDRGADINLRDDLHGGSAIGWADFAEQREMVELLLSFEARFDLLNASQYNCIGRLTALFDEHPEWIEDPEKGPQALRCAAYGGHADAVRLILERGVDPNGRSEDGKTALGWAEERDRQDVAKLLREKGGVI